MAMREEDVESYFKFMEHYEKVFAHMSIIDWERDFVF